MRLRYALIGSLLLMPLVAFAGGKGGYAQGYYQGYYAPPCHDPYYYCTGNDLYEKLTDDTDQFVKTCANGCNSATGACIDENPPQPVTYTPPSCTITFDKNPVAPGESTTMHWSSSNAYSMYINTVGYVDPSGSATVNVNQTTDLSGVATGYNAPAGAPAPTNQTSAPPPPSNTVTFTTPGTYEYTWTAPTGVTQVHATVVGGGGGGAGGQAPDDDGGCDCILGSGGGAGGAQINETISVTPGQTYQVIVGRGGLGGIHRSVSYCPSTFPGANGGDSSFGTLVAHGGQAGSGIYTGGAGGTPGGTAGCGGTLYSGGSSCGGTNATSHGAGGTGGGCYVNGGNGADGYVSISWDSPAPSTETPPPNSVSVSCAAVLTTDASLAPSARIRADSVIVALGDSIGVHADYTVGTGDTLGSSRIDSPEGNAVTGSSALAHRDYSFAPAVTGLYTFFARLASAKFPTLKTYDSVGVQVSENTACGSGQYFATDQPYGGECICKINNALPINGQCESSCTLGQHSSGGVCLCDNNDTAPVFGECHMCTVGTPVCAGPDVDGDSIGDSIAHISNALTCAVDTSNLTACSSGYHCVSGQCTHMPPTAYFRALPGVVAKGNASSLAWFAAGVQPSSCSVTGPNGQAFSSVAIGSAQASGSSTGACSSANTSCPLGSVCLGTQCINAQPTAAITSRSTFNLACTGLDGTPLRQSVTIGIAPTHSEH